MGGFREVPSIMGTAVLAWAMAPGAHGWLQEGAQCFGHVSLVRPSWALDKRFGRGL
jgi:hypothetical protein